MTENTQNHQQGFQKTFLHGFDKVQKIFPHIADWKPEDIEAHKDKLKWLENHFYDYGCTICGEPGHTILAPMKESGVFERIKCPVGWRHEVKERESRAGFPRRFMGLLLNQLDDSEAKQQAIEYVMSYEAHKKEGRGLLIAGGTGAGKTQLAVSTARAIINKYLEWVKFTTVYDFLEAAKNFKAREERINPYDSIINAELLVLDDLGADRLTDFAINELIALIDYRYREMRPIIVSTNLSKSDLSEYLNPRVTSRLSEMCVKIILAGPDRREGR
jgi:DNA replication protein DnaC